MPLYTPVAVPLLRGAYAAGTTYALNDLVTNAGSTWRSLENGNIGNTPAEGAHWTVLAQAGADATAVTAGPGAVSGNVNTTSTVLGDVTGATCSPNTTSAIQLVASGMIGLIGSASAGAGNPGGIWKVVDDLGAVIGVHQQFGVFTGASQAITQSLHLVLDITPASASRTYKLQHALAATYTGLTVRAYGPITAGSNAVRMFSRTP